MRPSIGPWPRPARVARLLALTGWVVLAFHGPTAGQERAGPDDPCGAGQADAREANDPRREEVREFVQRYFRTWSTQDMKGYDDCFHSDAIIQYIDARGLLETTPRRQFVAGQREYHRNAPHKTTEVPETIDVRLEAKLARAVVYWKLTSGPRVEYGYDHFTLLKQGESWRIINLVFYPAARKAGD